MLIFLSYSIDINTPFCGGGKGFTSVSSESIEKGGTANTSKWDFPNHLGTHIDSLYHFYQNGQTSDDFPANFWFFNEKSVQISKVNLSDDDLLIKPEHIADKDCNWVREKFKKIRILGIDSISISSWQHRNVGRQVHKKMLNPKKPILLVEDMNLSKVNKDTVFKIIYVAPLIISKSDGAPCTILAEVIDQ